jgi:glycosyltransferase involved in cell wall biosynthesis
MKITAYPLYGPAADLQPLPEGNGWHFLCPCAFEAVWHGGPAAGDVEIRLAESAPGQIEFVQSLEGEGRLTFYPGYQCKTEAEHALWVRGPINASKDGIVPLESVIDTSILPGTLTIQWRLTRPGQTVRFEAGEPFCTLLPYPKAGLDGVTVEVIQPAGSLDDYDLALESLAESQGLQDVLQRLAAGDAAAPVRGTAKSRWAAGLATPPEVTCICSAQGRVELLEEAIQSFLRQDYPGPKQLIVLNDVEGQTLEYDHPEVHVVNVPRRFHSDAEKLKAAVGLASHDLLFPWPEDDISLPHRLSFTVAHLAEPAVFWKADKAWLWNGEELSGPETEALPGGTLHGGTLHGGSCFRRETFVKHHGYSHTETDYAGAFEALCASGGPGAVHLQAVEPAEVFSIRRGEALNGHEPSRGRIQLRPRWRQDYDALVQEHLGIAASEPPSKPPAKPAAKTAAKTEDINPFPPPFHVIPPPPPLPAEELESLFRGASSMEDYPLRISVILPATNESVMLRRTVEQFVATLPANSEVIVVDNGSTDGCADFLAEGDFLAQGRWENVRLIRSTEPLGVAAARNRGLAEARGEVVVFSDAHMDVPERWWQPLVRTLNLPNVGVAAPGIGVMGSPDYPVSCGQRIAETNLRLEWLPLKSAEPGPVPTLGGGFMAMRHDTLKRAGAFDEGMPQWGSEDLEICVRYWLLGYEVWVVPEVTVMHYFRNARPYGVQWHLLTHNLLRVALLHFSHQRLARVASALRNHIRFGAALAQAVESDVWQKRAEFAARRVRDDDWLFEKFKDSCNV